MKEYVELEYYPNGNIKDYIHKNSTSIKKSDLEHWASQMIGSIAYIHSKGVTHADLRLDQWLVDVALNARLSDFNAAGFDDQSDLGLRARQAMGLERASHCLPREVNLESTVASDLFALGSSIYELVAGEYPYKDMDEELIQSLFEAREFPEIDRLVFGHIIRGCWMGVYASQRTF
jgi:serine/threonine protein kinase